MVRHIQETVAEHFEIPIAAMTSTRALEPKSELHIPRHTAMFFARRVANKTYPDIAHRFGRKDHTTVIYAERKIERMMGESALFADEIKTLAGAIGSNKYTVEKSDQLVGDSSLVGA